MDDKKPIFSSVRVEPGKPLQFTDEPDNNSSRVVLPPPHSSVGITLRAYTDAARKLLEGKYEGQKNLAPPHLRDPCDIFIAHCTDGVLVRYDIAPQDKTKIRSATLPISISEAAPQFSEQVIFFSDDPGSFVPNPIGPEIILQTVTNEGLVNIVAKHRPFACAPLTFPTDFRMPPPSSRPPCFLSIVNEFDIQLHGIIESSEKTSNVLNSDSQQFIAHNRFRISVGWQMIEVFPTLANEYWRPEYAATWAEHDLLATIMQKNLRASRLTSIDSRGNTRREYTALLREFETLLAGPEEPAHQFLKKHAQLLCPTYDRRWSKLAFGDRVSDFVFREPFNDYLLVEIEAPIRQLFRKDGQQREELTHAINQITDWIQYISDNKQKVEDDLGLVGISSNPRTLVVIGRSASLTESNRKKLSLLQAQQNKLRILTYDDLIANARANLEKILGPLDIQGESTEFYFFKGPPPSLG